MSQILKIIPPEPGEHKLASSTGTKVVTEDGREIDGVTEVTISMVANDFVRATLSVLPVFDRPVWAEGFMSETSFLAAAERYGYEVKKKEPENEQV